VQCSPRFQSGHPSPLPRLPCLRAIGYVCPGAWWGCAHFAARGRSLEGQPLAAGACPPLRCPARRSTRVHCSAPSLTVKEPVRAPEEMRCTQQSHKDVTTQFVLGRLLCTLCLLNAGGPECKHPYRVKSACRSALPVPLVLVKQKRWCHSLVSRPSGPVHALCVRPARTWPLTCTWRVCRFVASLWWRARVSQPRRPCV